MNELIDRPYMKFLYVLLAAFLVAPLLAAAVLLYWSRSAARFQDLERLLAGDTEIEITALKIVGQGQEITINDSDTLTYLTRSFRGAQKEGYVPTHQHGYTHLAYIDLGTSEPVMVGCNVPAEEDGITIDFPIDSFGEPKYLWIPLTKPVPPGMSAVVAQMRTPIRKELK